MTNIIDTFAIVIVIIVFFLTLIDWWIGPEGRAKMKEWVENAWLVLVDMEFEGLLRRDLSWVINLITAREAETLSFRRVLWRSTVFVVLSIPVTYCATVVLSPGLKHCFNQNAQDYFQQDPEAFVRTFNMTQGRALDAPLQDDDFGSLGFQDFHQCFGSDAQTSILVLVLPSIVFAALLAWIATIYVMRLTEKRFGLLWLVGGLLGSVVTGIAVFGLGLLLVILLVGLWMQHVGGLGPFGYSFGGYTAGFLVQHPHNPVGMSTTHVFDVWPHFFRMGLIVSLLPVLLLMLLVAVFLLSRMFQGVLKPASLRVLYLFHASKQGVLTQVAIGLGVLAKFIQELVKYLAGS